MTDSIVWIQRGKERMFEKRHPWLFSGALSSRNDSFPADGDIITLRGESGAFLAKGYWNHHSQIRVHVLTWDEEELVDEAFWRRRIQAAIARRDAENTQYSSGAPNAYRLINAENDGLPGLVVDRYADWLVLQALTLGIDKRKQMITEILMQLLFPAGIYERSDADIRSKEGLRASVGVLTGQEPPPLVEIVENGCKFLVDVYNGHKTGFYLDQRDNRAWLGNWLKTHPQADRQILNCFSYTGGFSVYAQTVGAAHAISVDASADALTLAKRNVTLNGLTVRDEDYIEADVFTYLRECRAANRQFDVIVLDPPKFAQSQAKLEGALRGYKDINWLAFQLIKSGGLLLTFSCSGLVDADLFQKVVFGALVDSGRDGQIIARLTAGADHPVGLTFPEGLYLKGLACRVE
jgi:23S rRNA (cytosine1962-C5)-methyltransferase